MERTILPGLLLLRLPPRGPAFLVDLGSPGEGQGARGNVFGDGRPGADVGPVPDRHGRHELDVATDEGLRSDPRGVLLVPVVIARDDPGADVRARADLRVAEVGEVLRLGALPDARVLGLHEVADLDVFLQDRTRAQA